jgi:hypothetical protein
MLSHHVLFWVKASTSEAQKKAFRASLETLAGVETVKTIHVGTPSSINRAVVDTSYTFSLLLLFENMEGHDIYQVHPLHKAFLDEFRDTFEKVVIYDSI